MPLYVYSNPTTGEEKEIFQSMSEEHSYSEDGVKWNRVFIAPNASIDTKVDPFSQSDFTERTASKKGTVGDMLDHSAEMSEMRAEKSGGTDPVKKKFFDDYAKKRNGQRHFSEKKSYESDKVKVDYD